MKAGQRGEGGGDPHPVAAWNLKITLNENTGINRLTSSFLPSGKSTRSRLCNYAVITPGEKEGQMMCVAVYIYRVSFYSPRAAGDRESVPLSCQQPNKTQTILIDFATLSSFPLWQSLQRVCVKLGETQTCQRSARRRRQRQNSISARPSANGPIRILPGQRGEDGMTTSGSRRFDFHFIQTFFCFRKLFLDFIRLVKMLFCGSKLLFRGNELAFCGNMMYMLFFNVISGDP